MDAHVQTPSQGIIRLETAKRTSEPKLRDQSRGCLMSLLEADRFVFAEKGAQNWQIRRAKSETLRKTGGKWRKTRSAHGREGGSEPADVLWKQEAISVLCTVSRQVNTIIHFGLVILQSSCSVLSSLLLLNKAWPLVHGATRGDSFPWQAYYPWGGCINLSEATPFLRKN